MKRLLTALAITLLIAACSDSPTGTQEPEFEPYRVGNFLITSDSTAEFAGVRGKLTNATSDADSMVITEPLDFGMTFERFADGRFNWTYIDSVSIGWPDIVAVEADSFQTASNFPKIRKRGTAIKTDFIKANGEISYPCRFNADDVGDVRFRYMTEDTLHTIITIKADGLAQALEEVRGC